MNSKPKFDPRGLELLAGFIRKGASMRPQAFGNFFQLEKVERLESDSIIARDLIGKWGSNDLFQLCSCVLGATIEGMGLYNRYKYMGFANGIALDSWDVQREIERATGLNLSRIVNHPNLQSACTLFSALYSLNDGLTRNKERMTRESIADWVLTLND